MTSAKVLIFVPFFNDSEHLLAIAEELASLSLPSQLLLIDDGSRNATTAAESASWLDRRVLHVRLPTNFGLGVCTNVAFDFALRHGFDVVVRVDADGQHPLGRIADMVSLLAGGQADVAVGIRQIGKQRSLESFSRRLVRGYFATCARLITGETWLSDVNTGFFAANRRAVSVLNRYELDRYPEPQFFVRAARAGLRLAPVMVDQKDRMFGKSTLNFTEAIKMIYRFNVLMLSELLTPGTRR